MIGISVYLNDLNYAYIDSAYTHGVREIFTSFKMIEEDYEQLLPAARELIKYCNQRQINLIADVDERSATRFGLQSLAEFQTIGLNHIRIDGGVSNQEIAELSKQFTIYLNASDIKSKDIEEQTNYGLKVENCVAMHNFYPLEKTGLCVDYFNQSNQMIKSFGIKVLAFIPGDQKLRGPVFNGLPSLERDRGSRPFVAYLKMKELVDQVFIGDNQISDNELRLIDDEGVIELMVDMFTTSDLCDQQLVIRPDLNTSLIRVTDRKIISPNAKGYIYELAPGAITVENKNAIERYQGEVQIIKSPCPSDRTKTVIGYVSTIDLPLLELIKPEHKIKFRNRYDR